MAATHSVAIASHPAGALPRLRPTVVLFVVALLPGIYELSHPRGIGFGAGYEMAAIARNFASQGVIGNPFPPVVTGPTAVVPPAYPFFLGVLLTLMSPVVAVLIAGIIGILVNALIAALMPRFSTVIFGDARPGLFAGALWIVSCRLLPNWDMNHTIACTLLFCLLSAHAIGGGHRFALWGMAAGLMGGLLILLNPATIFMAAPWTLWLLLSRRIPLRRVLLYSSAAALAAAACLLPWILRNNRMLGHPVLRTNLGMTLYSSNNDCAQSGLVQDGSNGCYESTHPVASVAEAELLRNLGEVEYDRRRTADALAWIRSHPRRFGQLTLNRIVEFWFPEPVGFLYPAYVIWLATVLSIPGLMLMARRRMPAVWFLAAVWLIYPLMYYVVVSCDRYRYPMLWTSLLPAGYLLSHLLPARRTATQSL